MKRRHEWLYCLFAVIVSLLCSSQNSARCEDKDPGPDFYATVQAEFPKWDLNRDGILSGDEILKAFQNPKVKGRPAATIIVLQRLEGEHAHKGHQEPLESFTLDQIMHLTKRTDKKGKHLNPEKSFEHYLHKLDDSAPQLFAHGVPQLGDIRQGGASDCYFLAVVGSLVHARPQDIVRMTRTNNDCTFTVSFYGEKPITVTCPTPGERAAYTVTHGDGIWLPVITKAYGKRQLNNHWRKTGVPNNLIDPLEAAAITGGSCAPVIKLFSGRESKTYKPKEMDSGDLRKKLVKAFAEHRVVTVGVPGHAMAGIDYDKDGDRLQMWNPWGSTGKYKALDAKMTHGLFWLPLNEATQKLTHISIEAKADEVQGESHAEHHHHHHN